LSRHSDVAILHLRLAKLELSDGRPQAAEEQARRALELTRELYDAEYVVGVVARARLGQALLAQGRVDEAEVELRASQEIAAASADRQLAKLQRELLVALIDVYTRQGREDEHARMQSLLDALESGVQH
jgi:tetratricopeptide (TPR) repeat protein